MDIDGKLRPLYLLRILREQTDENHKLSTVQLCKLLKDEYGIDTFRTTIKTDIEVLQQAGYSIEVTRSSQNMYNYIEREFGTQEITAILDAVLCSKVMAHSSREQIAAKLYKLAGPFRTQELKRNWINREVDTQNKEQIVAIVDTINEAINKRRKIRFRKFDYNVKKERTVVNGGAPYVISPYSLFTDSDDTYVVGCPEKEQCICVHRLDRIFGVPEILDDIAVPLPAGVDSKYSAVPFDVGSSSRTEVEMQVDNSLMGEIIDRFGYDITTYACDQQSFRVIATIGNSIAFYNWIFSFQGKVKLRGPEAVCQEYESMVRKAAESLNLIPIGNHE